MTKKARNTRLEKLVKQNAARRAEGRVFRVETLFSVEDKRQADLAEFLGNLPRGGASSFVRDAVWEKRTREQLGIGNGIQQHETASEQIEALFAELAAQRRAMTDEFATTPTVDYHEQRYTDLKAEFETVRADNAALRSEVQDLIGVVRDLAAMVKDLRDNPPRVTVQMAQAAQVTVDVSSPRPDTLPEDGAVVSSGLDMSRDRPRPRLKPGVVVTPAAEPDVLSEADSIRLAKVMAASIAAYSGVKT